MLRLLTLLLALLLAFGCNNSSSSSDDATTTNATSTEAYGNPAAPGFNSTDSDAKAIEIADAVVEAYGGRKAYDENRFFKWNFFGARDLVWDKADKRVRIDFPSRNAIYLLNYGDMSGRVQIDGEEVTQPDSLAKYLDQAHGIWINDSYWLVHQFKLKDSGVTLKYVKEVTADPLVARPSYVIDQTFSEVGNTPQNKYRLFIDKESHKINTWQFFRDAADEEAAMETPWRGEIEENGIIISTDRSGRFQLNNTSLPTTVADAVFEEF